MKCNLEIRANYETAENLVNIRCVVYFNIYLFGKLSKDMTS